VIISPTQSIELLKSREFAKHEKSAFLVFEGVNGSGKSTLLRAFAALLERCGAPVQTSREPGSTELGIKLRQILLEFNGDAVPISARAELLLFAADRAQHVETIIKPALATRRNVLSDRYHYSTLAFQGYGRGLDLQSIREINSIATANLEPDLVILLDLPAQKGLERIKIRNEGKDIFEHEVVEFHKKVRYGYCQIAKMSETPFLLLDAEKSPEALLEDIAPLAACIAENNDSAATTTPHPKT
jgi:dTMP kinase